MRTILLAFIFSLPHLFLSAQQAPDFTITDIDGQVHHLYSDYLNQGKSVLLEVFFTNCPPCNSIAPLMEPFYQEWGAGQNDVEFFQLSDKNYDTNTLVEDFADTYNVTFISAGVEGGSIAAVQPYKNGQFGQWYGTPTYVVIAPDGTLQYNVEGAGNQGTIDAIDAALTATGAEKPGSTPVAPDFTLTDTEGQLHHLYADYLSQGKTVVIEVFNTTCSPCNSIAPLLQPLYEDWGGGDGDVEFFIMTDKITDSDPVVFDHQIDYDQTFPGISEDGGSIAAVQLYKNGTFGPWVQNPTFVVIAPDGTVAYDVHGANNQATIDAIDAAIAATGASPVSPLTLAPDFTVTDIDGQVHHLYADYLNQGKTVMIEVFYTTCPPCNSIAPLIEPLYQEWGAGDYDVEFFEMSDKNFDTDALVEAYQNNYDETFIGVSKDGGSLAAVQPYKNGSFGPWYGTPTFVVIAPDKTVQYDVSGANNQATIEAIDAALAATGAEKPGETPQSLTGSVTFLDGSAGVGNAAAQIVNGAGNVIFEDISDANGAFTLEFLLSEVQPDWDVRVVKTDDPLNGVSAIDLIRIQKHLLAIDTIHSPLGRIAADANRSISISTLDIVTLLKLLLGITSDFSDGQSWVTFAADTDFGPPSQQTPVISTHTIPLQDIIDGIRDLAFIGVKKGDVNGNADPD